MFGPCLEEHVPEPLPGFGARVEFPAELAHIGQAHRGDPDSADDHLGTAEVLQRLVGEVVLTDLGHDLAGQRPPQPDAAGGAGDVRDVRPRPRVGRRLTARLHREVVEVDVRVHAELEAFLAQPRDGHVRADPAVGVQQQAVGDRPGLLGDVAGAQPLQQGQCPGAGDLQALERGHVVHCHGGAGRVGLGRRDLRMELVRPRVTLGTAPGLGQGIHQVPVRLEPVRTLPARRFQVEGAEFVLAGAERARAQVARGGARLQRVANVVDLHEVLLGGLADVFLRGLQCLEAGHLALVQGNGGLPVNEQLGHGAGDAGRVRHPHGLGKEEALQLRCGAHQRASVRGEGEDPVEAVVDRPVAQRRQQDLRVLPGVKEVLLGEVQPRRHLVFGHAVGRHLRQRVKLNRHRAVGV